MNWTLFFIIMYIGIGIVSAVVIHGLIADVTSGEHDESQEIRRKRAFLPQPYSVLAFVVVTMAGMLWPLLIARVGIGLIVDEIKGRRNKDACGCDVCQEVENEADR